MSDNQTENLDQGFNDSELEDIMNEIESLEKEFAVEGADESETPMMEASEDLAIEEAGTNGLQDVIDREVESIESELHSTMAEESDEVSAAADSFVDSIEDEVEAVAQSDESVMEEVEVVSNVVAFEPKKTTTTHTVTSGSSDMNVQLSGQMNMAMTFPVGDSQAEFTVNGGELSVQMNGMSISISENEGCTVTMENGVKFTIPLTTSSTHSKKSAA
ncbi:hypothetical protein M899_2658 [Bacteriovorax sp. BSW11_IV]|uniref:hypothetical protein n=1 Tax=Bacteriovorax sp. BSW11_IV TaxID=1353529 RepID=UPI00038A4D8D|nr:hypothetical protein [Bacteriovorax sp. BSW11_IV]EQC48160.1 hypothetical protein M899_2658 [Bacteriovorax sp. BSW11_IV]